MNRGNALTNTDSRSLKIMQASGNSCSTLGYFNKIRTISITAFDIISSATLFSTEKISTFKYVQVS